MGNRMRYILGVNCAHDAAACLMVNGKLEVAILEERLTRRKHQEGVPINAITYCLKAGRVGHIKQIETIVVNCYSYQEPTVHHESPYCICPKCYGPCIVNPSHHLLHALYAVFASGFDETAVLIADGSGHSYAEYARRNRSHLGPPPQFHDVSEAESLYYFSDNKIAVVEKRWGQWIGKRFNRWQFESLGHMYSAASQFIFGGWMHAGKTMGLAPFGKKDALNLSMLEINDKHLHVDPSWVVNLERVPGSATPWKEAYCMDLAASVQHNLEAGMLFLANKLFAETQCPNLCLSGGVALNGVANARIKQETQFKNVYVTPAAGDGGIAIGAAIFGHYLASANTEKLACGALANDFHGKEYTHEEMVAAVAKYSDFLHAVDCPNRVACAVTDIIGGKVVGWFEGRSEFGPRALGHRSILADPRSDDMRDHLNRNVKLREEFRPYGACVLSERAQDYFDLVADDPYMLSVVRVRKDKVHEIPAVCHIDGTTRIQTIDAGYQGELRNVLAGFYEQTAVPVLLNTSLNGKGEPIVESPADAVNCLIGCEIDVLYMGSWRITKSVSLAHAQEDDWPNVIPEVSPLITLTKRDFSVNGELTPTSCSVSNASGYELQIVDLQYRLLGLVNGQRSLREIYEALRRSTACDKSVFKKKVEGLARNGVLRFKLRRQDVS